MELRLNGALPAGLLSIALKDALRVFVPIPGTGVDECLVEIPEGKILGQLPGWPSDGIQFEGTTIQIGPNRVTGSFYAEEEICDRKVITIPGSPFRIELPKVYLCIQLNWADPALPLTLRFDPNDFKVKAGKFELGTSKITSVTFETTKMFTFKVDPPSNLSSCPDWIKKLLPGEFPSSFQLPLSMLL